MQENFCKPLLWSHSQIGASHIRKNKPNQDNVGTLSIANGLVNILVVSDGHGSERYCRSEIGSKLAIKVARHVCEQFFDPLPTLNDLKTRIDLFKNRLIFEWKKEISEYSERFPFSEIEQSLLINSSNQYIAYGATLVIAIITPKYAIYVQLGDGDIIVIDQTQKVFSPIPAESDILGVETHSLCEENSEKFFRIYCTPYDQPPHFVLVATDGYANSFATNADFLDMMIQLNQKILNHGLGAVLDALPLWLKETTEGGSGDDISVALLSYNSFGALQNDSKSTDSTEQSSLLMTETTTIPKIPISTKWLNFIILKQVSPTTPNNYLYISNKT